MDQAMAFETVIANHSVKYGWARELIKVFRNGFKYNFGPALVHWKKTAIPKSSQLGLVPLMLACSNCPAENWRELHH
jgi:hypothetical protein